MAITFEWNDSYTVGNEEIDKQHKYLFELGNRLPEVADEDGIHHLIMDLFKYTREHFATEEEMMRSIGYPNLDEHIQLHDDLISKLSTISENEFTTDAEIYKFKEFVYLWLSKHILEEDNKYFVFNQNK
jgi:hemerythrin